MKEPKHVTSSREFSSLSIVLGSLRGGVTGIFETKCLRAKAWKDGGAGDAGIYCRAYLEQGDDKWHQSEILRVLSQTVWSGKNEAGIIFEGTTSGELIKIQEGGIDAEHATVSERCFTHFPREKRWCVAPQRILLTAALVCWTPTTRFLET